MGIDPKIELIPKFFIEEIQKEDPKNWEVKAIEAYSKEITNAVYNISRIFKPQVAYFEKYGWKGIKALEHVILEIRKKKGIIILDGKRNDIGSTSHAYASAYLDPKNTYGINVDAITINGYLGTDAINPFLEFCKEHDKGIFVLVKTSNPSSIEIQDRLVIDNNRGKKVFEIMGEKVKQWGEKFIGYEGYSSVGAVVGATFPNQARKLRIQLPHTIFLVPGYGAQGGTTKDILPNFNEDRLGAIINSSRKIMYAYKYFEGFKPEEFREAAFFSAEKMKHEINEALNEI